jgi:integrase/recombinase XerC
MKTATRLGESTQKRYAYEVERFAQAVGNGSINDLTPQDLLAWNAGFWETGAAPATVQQKHAAVKKFLDYLDSFEKLPRARELLEAFKQVQAPQRQTSGREPYALTQAQVNKVLEAVLAKPSVGRRDHAIVTLLWAAGLRRSELANLPLDKLDLQERRATVVGKGLKEREVFFDQATAEILAGWMEQRATWKAQDDTVFLSSEDGRRLSANTISAMVREGAQRAGLRKEVWPHLFRHTRITELLERGMSLQRVARFAGHSNVNTTMGYYHEDSGRMRDDYDQAMAPRGAARRRTPAPRPEDTVGEGTL